jgi:hypothetical protein
LESQKLSKDIDKYSFLKVLGSPETLFQKGFWWGPGAKPLADKPQFEALSARYPMIRGCIYWRE